MAIVRPEATPTPIGGSFPGTIVAIEDRESQAGNKYISVRSRVDQNGESYTSFGRAMYTGKAKWQLAALFEAAGLEGEANKARAGEEVNTDLLVGARLLMEVVPEVSEKNGETYLNTKNFHRLS